MGDPDAEHVWRRQARWASGAWTEAAPSPICVPSPTLPCPSKPPSFFLAVTWAEPGAVFGAPRLVLPPPGPRQGRGGQRSGLPHITSNLPARTVFKEHTPKQGCIEPAPGNAYYEHQGTAVLHSGRWPLTGGSGRGPHNRIGEIEFLEVRRGT
ncbi:hypothetical protein NDU88_009994 [Pleurodeles waltl]|uniref:Uncharacterized protein n=1 Tax=Pleurodeles waltl TaxID=8319 RepID=A0AAV7QXB9_PLEWA|nr:hypothetical protein NDU88_009994 [Pleurodeles waltl]